MRFATAGVLVLGLAADPAAAQECPTGKPAVVTRVLPAALGQAPLWVTSSGWPIKWEGSAAPVQLVWIIDATARGQIIVSGRHTGSGAAVRFTSFGDRLGARRARYRLDRLGYNPTLAKPDDFKKHSFDRNYAWFPEPGCYELSGRVGTTEVTLHVEVTGKPAT